MTVAATVTFYRPSTGWRDLTRPYQLIIDGQTRGAVRRGTDRSFVVAPGRHWAQARIGRTGSPRIEFEVGPGNEIRLTVVRKGSSLSLSLAGDSPATSRGSTARDRRSPD